MITNDAQKSLLFGDADHASRPGGTKWELDSMLEEIASVAGKTKSMSVFSISEDLIGDDLYIKLLKETSNMDLMTVIHKRLERSIVKGISEVFLFIVPREELWRVPAYLSMKRAFSEYEWSDGAEFLESSLLGFSDSQAKSWVNEHRRKRIGWLGPTCYFLTSDAQRDAMSKLANRCIDPSSIAEDIEVFYNTDNTPPKENACELLPAGANLCRASVKFDFFKKIFERDILSGQKVHFFVSAINAENAADLNEALQSNFEFLDG
jgi:hypothetical protein